MGYSAGFAYDRGAGVDDHPGGDDHEAHWAAQGFLTFSGGGGLCALLAAYAIVLGSFALFCLAVMLIGTNSAFGQQYRFAAAESVELHFAARAVSFLLLSGVVAARKMIVELGAQLCATSAISTNEEVPS